MKELLLPLFPLEIVLLPEEILPLHIFEERYKEMIGDCLAAHAQGEERNEFGIVWAREKEINSVGCTAQVSQITRKYPDGRMDILTCGKRRFEILFTDSEEAYLRAGVEFFEDESGADVPPEKEVRQTVELFRKVMERLRNSPDIPTVPSAPYRRLSYHLAAFLPLDLSLKQQLLVLRHEEERLRELTRALEEMLPQLDRIEASRHKAGGNGNLRPRL